MNLFRRRVNYRIRDIPFFFCFVVAKGLIRGERFEASGLKPCFSLASPR